MNSLQTLLNENRLMSLTVPYGWLMIKNNLFDVDLDWLNELEHTNDDDYFVLMEFYFKYNVFNAYFNFVNNGIISKYEGINLYVSSYPIMENGKIIRLEYDVDLSINKKRTRKGNVALICVNGYGKRFLTFDDVKNALNRLMIIVSFDIEKMLENNDFSAFETLLERDKLV